MQVVARYPDTGIASHYESHGLCFEWTDWVLCEIAFTPTNPIHLCMASSFSSYTTPRGMLIVHCQIWNPSYDQESKEVNISKLFHFVPLRVVTNGRRAS